MCSGSALLGDLLLVSRSKERDLLSVLSIYPRILFRVCIVCRLQVGFLFCVVVFCYMFVCVCFGLVVNNCQVIGWKDSSDDAFMCSYYYCTGAVSCVWYVAWLMVARHDMRGHPWITDDEKQHILQSSSQSEDTPPSVSLTGSFMYTCWGRASCGLRGCKNRPAPFTGWRS